MHDASTSSRRRFLASAMGGAAALYGASAYTGKAIDTHVHFYDPTRPQGVPWPPANDELLYRPAMPERFRKVTTGLGVIGVVVVEASAWLEDNQWLLDLAKDEKLIVGIVGRLEPGAAAFPENLRRFAKNPLFRGIRLGGTQIKAGLQSAQFLEHIRALAAADLQLDAIGNQAMLPDLVRLSDQVPKLRIVIDHMPLDPIGAASALKEIGGRKQIYSKVSGVLRSVSGRVPEDTGFYRAGLDELWETFGSDRLIYASNWPVSDKLAPYGTVFKVVQEYFSAKGAEAAERYFFKNSQAAYRWKARS